MLDKKENVLKKIRKENHLTQQEVADRIPISKSMYEKWENGKNPISNENLTALLKIYCFTARKRNKIRHELYDEIEDSTEEINALLDNFENILEKENGHLILAEEIVDIIMGTLNTMMRKTMIILLSSYLLFIKKNLSSNGNSLYYLIRMMNRKLFVKNAVTEHSLIDDLLFDNEIYKELDIDLIEDMHIPSAFSHIRCHLYDALIRDKTSVDQINSLITPKVEDNNTFFKDLDYSVYERDDYDYFDFEEYYYLPKKEKESEIINDNKEIVSTWNLYDEWVFNDDFLNHLNVSYDNILGLSVLDEKYPYNYIISDFERLAKKQNLKNAIIFMSAGENVLLAISICSDPQRSVRKAIVKNKYPIQISYLDHVVGSSNSIVFKIKKTDLDVFKNHLWFHLNTTV